jgi:hypothetical protein
MSRAAVADPRKSTRKMMRTLGYITMAAVAAALGLVAVKSLPDMRRYLTMRKI